LGKVLWFLPPAVYFIEKACCAAQVSKSPSQIIAPAVKSSFFLFAERPVYKDFPQFIAAFITGRE
jgi:hypothetical protein